MRVWVVVVLACGCDAIFGIHDPRVVVADAQQFDAPSDAPFACSNGVPVFSPLLHQVVFEDCGYYTTGGGLAAAFCNDVDGLRDGFAGAELRDTRLTGAPGTFDVPRLTPEGDELWVMRREPIANRPVTLHAFSVYVSGGPHAWLYVRDLALSPGATGNDWITAPSRKVGGVRHFLHYAFDARTLYEYTDDDLTTRRVRGYTPDELGVLYFQKPNLTADGLRLVFVSTPDGGNDAAVYFSARRSIDDPFPPAQILMTAPVANDPFLTEDCSRLYTNGLGSVFYAQQL